MNNKFRGIIVFLLFSILPLCFAADPFDPGLNWHSLQQIATNETGLVSVDADADSIIDTTEACDGDSSCEMQAAYVSGKVGIGTPVSGYQLDVNSGSSHSTLKLESDWGQIRFIPYTTSINYIESGNSDWTGSNELHITGYNANNLPAIALLADKVYTMGNVGIGTTSPSYKLHVSGDFYANTVNTGNGNYEINSIAGYVGDQNLRTTDSPSFNNLYVTGSIYSADTSILDIGKDTGDRYSIRDGTDYWMTDGAWKIYWNSAGFYPYVDNDMDLGSSSREWKNGYFDGLLYTDTLVLGTTASTVEGAMWLQ